MAEGGSVWVSVQCCVCACVPRAGLCTCEGRGAAWSSAGRLAPPRAPRGLSAAQPPAPPRPGRAAALTPSLDPPRPGRTGGSLVAVATSDPRMLIARYRLSPPHRGCRAVGGARSTRLPRCGLHSACCCSSPTQWTCSPCTEGRSKVQMWPGWWWGRHYKADSW